MSTALKVGGGTVAAGSLFYSILLLQQYIQQSNLPPIDPRTDAYSRCIGRFLTDMESYTACLDRKAGKECILDDNRMTSMEDSHNCFSLITPIPTYTTNAQVLSTAHDVCYIFLKNYGECFGMAVEMDDFEPCFRREVFARVAIVVQQCKNDSGIAPDEDLARNPGSAMGNTFGK